MQDIIVVIITVVLMMISTPIGFHLGKKMTGKMPFVFIGLRKKNRVVLRDERLIPAYWKARFWAVWIMIDSAAVLVLTGFAVARGNRPLVAGVLVTGAVAAVALTIMWRKRWAEFYKLKDELGVVLEHDVQAEKAAIEVTSKYVYPLFGLSAGIFTVLSVTNFIQTRMLQGVIFAGFAVVYLVIIIIHALKKKRGSKTAE